MRRAVATSGTVNIRSRVVGVAQIASAAIAARLNTSTDADNSIDRWKKTATHTAAIRVRPNHKPSPMKISMATAMGAHGERVTSNDEFMPAFERARASGKAALIELVTDPERISTRTTVTKLRASAK